MEKVLNSIGRNMREGRALVLILAIALSLFSFAVAAAPGNVVISSSGIIAYGALPLHIDGRYIKDYLGRTVILRGINMPRFIDTPYGDWLLPDGGVIWSTWDANAAIANLDAMKSWGVNVVRTLSTVEWWATNAGNHRQIIKEWITLAAQRGIYVVYGFWRVTGSGQAADLPYPPYCEDNNYIRSESDFVELWHGIANELKIYPNVMFELWNEPNGDSTAEASWFNVVQQTVNAIRSTRSTNIIVVHWGYCLWVNMEGQGAPGTYAGLDWVQQHPLNDSAGNILYSTHIYRDNLQKDYPTLNAYSYEDLKACFHITKVDYVINTLTKPLWIGEVGPNQWQTDLENEYSFYNNTLRIMNEWYVGYCAWWWWVTGTAWGHIEGGLPNYTPNRAGQILQYGIATGTLPPANATG
jgi:hypothetical protein